MARNVLLMPAMNLTLQILCALLLDLAIGDPKGFPHPVRLIGALAQRLEAPLRRRIRSAKGAGVLAVLITVGTTIAAIVLLLWLAGLIHPWLADLLGVIVLYTTIAAHDLVRHSMDVYHALAAGDLPAARRRVARIVGRDTEALDVSGVTRAAVECVAESTVDGVTAPLFYALLFGPAGAMAYRAINTLDSTFGYKTERLLHFGWASARLDDLANWLPARLTAPLVAVAAGLTGRSPCRPWRLLRRDGHKHESPNSGLTEAAMAGALNVQLGGMSSYAGEPLAKPVLGDPGEPLHPGHIVTANLLMLLTLLLFAAIGLALRMAVAALLCQRPWQ